MKKPTRQDTINLRVWRHQSGIGIIEGITGIIDYPLAAHRPLDEFEEIQEGIRTRYSGDWLITHIPTGKSMGIISNNWDAVSEYFEAVKDHPTLLMMTDKTMVGHPMYKDMVQLHKKTKSRLGL